jgi:hypothetical protein
VSSVTRWFRIVVLALIAIGGATASVVLIGGTWGYVGGGIVLFLVIALGSPLALRDQRPLLPGAPVGHSVGHW